MPNFHNTVQIDYLQQNNRDLERRLREALVAKEDATQKIFNVSTKNEELSSELREVDRLANRLQADNDVVIAAADRTMTDAKVELRHTAREVEGLELEIEQMKQVSFYIFFLYFVSS